MTAAADVFTVTEAGVYDMPDDVYHADPVPEGSLSVSGAKLLLPPSCPARYAADRAAPREPTRTFDIGHAAHTMVLGTGAVVVAVDAPDWRTKAAREEAEAARAKGQIPLLAAEVAQVIEMTKAISEHPIAGPLFMVGGAEWQPAEQSIFWRDQEFGIWRRARPDWLHEASDRLIVVDYKTTSSASPTLLGKHTADFGYHMQAAWYLDAVCAVLGADNAAFIFVYQEKTPPYLVTVAELDSYALHAGNMRNRRALEIYRDCVEADEWPGYSNGIELMSLPAWAVKRDEEIW